MTNNAKQPEPKSNRMPVRSLILFVFGWIVAVGILAGLVEITPPDYRILVYIIAIPLLLVILASVSGNLRQKVARWTARRRPAKK